MSQPRYSRYQAISSQEIGRNNTQDADKNINDFAVYVVSQIAKKVPNSKV